MHWALCQALGRQTSVQTNHTPRPPGAFSLLGGLGEGALGEPWCRRGGWPGGGSPDPATPGRYAGQAQ